MYIGTKEAAERWGISERRIRALCRNGKIDGAVLEGKTWKIPSNAKKPADGRESAKGVLSTIAELKHELDSLHPLTPDEVKALNEQFAVEYTYNSKPSFHGTAPGTGCRKFRLLLPSARPSLRKAAPK